MPANMIIFEAEYIAELASGMNIACTLMSEAVKFLKKASLHEGWKCKECAKISDNMDDLNMRLGRLDDGVNETTRILNGSISRFAELEAKYRSQVEGLSEDLRDNHGFTASGYSGSSEPSGMEIAGGAAGAAGGAAGGAHGAAPSPGMQPGIRPPSVNVNVRPGMGGGQPPAPGMPSGNVQLPVTHIPDKPDAAASGVKAVVEVEEAAVSGVSESIIMVLGTSGSMSVSQRNIAVQSMVQAYAAGRSVADSTFAVISSPTQAHVQENIAMASGLVSLAGGIAAVSNIGSAHGEPEAGGAGTFSAAALATNAESIIENIGNDSDSEEVKEVLKSITSNNNAGGRASSGNSNSIGNQFLERLKASLMQAMNGEVSLGFLGTVSMQDFMTKVF